MRAQRKSSHQLHQHPAKKKMATKSKCSIFHIIAYGRVDKLCHPTSFVVLCCHGQNGVWVTHPNFLPLSHSTYVGRDMTFQRSAASQWSVCVPLAGRTPPFPSHFYPVVLGVRSSEPQRLLPQVNGQWRARQHCRHRSLKSNLQFKFGLSKGD